jgi:ankyrin repeat protein
METSSTIRAALYKGDRAQAERLAQEHGADVFEAAALGDVGRLETCLREQPTGVHAWSDDGFTALHFAAFLGGADAVRLLVEAGSDVGAVARNEMLVEPLHSAAANGDVESCRILLAAGADPNARQQHDFTPMDEAVQEDNQPLIALLQSYGVLLD